MAMAFGGRIAEELIFGEENVTTGAAGDIQMATQRARAMVTQFGMSEKLGRVRYDHNEQEVFLGHSVTQSRNVSEVTANVIDQEVRRIIEQGEENARRILTQHTDELHRVAQALLEYETLSGDEVRAVIRGEDLDRPEPEEPAPPPPPKKPGHRASVPTGGTKSGLGPEPQGT